MGNYRRKGRTGHYRKKKANRDRIRCKSCGILFGYDKGRTAKEAILMHIGLTKECNEYYNRRAADAHTRTHRRESRGEAPED